jgi:DNA polymerase III delta prime subunit
MAVSERMYNIYNLTVDGYRLIDWWLPGVDQLIILDEADSMTNDAQNALRRIMEKFTENVRFCLIGNYLSKIIPALQSRSFITCSQFLWDEKHEKKKSFEGLAHFEKKKTNTF